jgi:hypothetical protein
MAAVRAIVCLLAALAASKDSVPQRVLAHGEEPTVDQYQTINGQHVGDPRPTTHE